MIEFFFERCIFYKKNKNKMFDSEKKAFCIGVCSTCIFYCIVLALTLLKGNCLVLCIFRISKLYLNSGNEYITFCDFKDFVLVIPMG